MCIRTCRFVNVNVVCICICICKCTWPCICKKLQGKAVVRKFAVAMPSVIIIAAGCHLSSSGSLLIMTAIRSTAIIEMQILLAFVRNDSCSGTIYVFTCCCFCRYNHACHCDCYCSVLQPTNRKFQVF